MYAMTIWKPKCFLSICTLAYILAEGICYLIAWLYPWFQKASVPNIHTRFSLRSQHWLLLDVTILHRYRTFTSAKKDIFKNNTVPYPHRYFVQFGDHVIAKNDKIRPKIICLYAISVPIRTNTWRSIKLDKLAWRSYFSQ